MHENNSTDPCIISISRVEDGIYMMHTHINIEFHPFIVPTLAQRQHNVDAALRIHHLCLSSKSNPHGHREFRCTLSGSKLQRQHEVKAADIVISLDCNSRLKSQKKMSNNEDKIDCSFDCVMYSSKASAEAQQ
jgi:hypothetical protein